MKLRTILMAIAMLVSTVGFAQTDLSGKSFGGTHLDIGGSKASTSQGDSVIDGVSAINYALALCYWYMLTNNMGLGLDVGYSSWSTTTPSFGSFESTNGESLFSISPTLSCFHPCYGDFGMTTRVGLTAGFGSRFNKTVDGSTETKTTDGLTRFGLQADIGAYYMYQSFIFFAYMGALNVTYNSYKIEPDGSDSYRDNLLSYSLLGTTKAFLIGMAWNLPFGGGLAE